MTSNKRSISIEDKNWIKEMGDHLVNNKDFPGTWYVSPSSMIAMRQNIKAALKAHIEDSREDFILLKNGSVIFFNYCIRFSKKGEQLRNEGRNSIVFLNDRI